MLVSVPWDSLAPRIHPRPPPSPSTSVIPRWAILNDLPIDDKIISFVDVEERFLQLIFDFLDIASNSFNRLQTLPHHKLRPAIAGTNIETKYLADLEVYGLQLLKSQPRCHPSSQGSELIFLSLASPFLSD